MFKSSLCFLVILLTQVLLGNAYNVKGSVRDNNLLVYTNAGPIQGIRATDGDYTMFMGIPFADVDVNNPFGPSTPHAKFEEPFEAYYDSVICPQIEEFNYTIVGVLDCLQLNVYVPDSASTENPIPVMVWIYGGGYSIGFANRYLYGPSYLVKHDVILVTINYRVGPYGFMCLDTPQVPGNQGLKDQLLGLRWVKDNIEFFGGDPNQITAFGQSVGSMSVHFHLLSPQEELFHRAIMHSGSAYTASIINDVDRTTPIKIAERLGVVTTNMDEALAFLATQSTDSVIRASSEIEASFWPCVESDHEGVEKIITDFSINVPIPKLRGKSILLGFTSDELISSFGNMAAEFFPTLTVFSDHLKSSFTFEEERREVLEYIVTNFYLGGQELNRDMLHEIADFVSDNTFVYPMERSIPRFLENGAEKLYYYKFSYIGERNFVRRKNNITIGGAAHTDELAFLFDMEYIPEEPTPEDQLTIDRMTLMWTNFAKYGDPTPEINSVLPVKWEPIVSGDTVHNYLDIDSELIPGVNPFHERMAFWNLFYETYGKYERGYNYNTSNAKSLQSTGTICLGISLILVLFS